jgi:hypothetical protein
LSPFSNGNKLRIPKWVRSFSRKSEHYGTRRTARFSILWTLSGHLIGHVTGAALSATETLKYDAIPASKSRTHASHNHRTHKSQIKTDTEPPHTLHTRFPTPHDTHNARTLKPRNKETEKETLEAHHLLSQRIRPHTNRNHTNHTSQPRTSTEPPHDPHTHPSEPNNAHSTYTIEPRIGTDRRPHVRLGRFPCSIDAQREYNENTTRIQREYNENTTRIQREHNEKTNENRREQHE